MVRYERLGPDHDGDSILSGIIPCPLPTESLPSPYPPLKSPLEPGSYGFLMTRQSLKNGAPCGSEDPAVAGVGIPCCFHVK